MSLLAEFEAVSPALVLGPTLSAMPSLEVSLEHQYALDPDRPFVVCRIRCDDPGRLDRVLADDGTIDEFERVDGGPERFLYRLRRSDSGVVDAYRQWVTVGGELLAGRATNGRWEIEMRFPNRDAFNTYHEFLQSEDVTFELRRLADGPWPDRPGDDGQATLTESQREALRVAYEDGFFEVPRGTGLSAIADALDISEQAVSERLRRGQARLIEEHVVPDRTRS
ncbi:helix-turn-helix domain-containing protein [Halosolutus amylolyticus]|uniref:Helix-turn-helix domain-containing protein n=1 Tax=Halosolutus amylolyticus TaxID=2932267 RepID=A0ABD5PS56_9EURY|nr:helix-turn-helix domain-containing protein [Halosolutus amylolyticus]